MKALITGADGFAGRHLSREMVAAGNTVASFDLHRNTTAQDTAESYVGDLLKQEDLDAAVKSSLPDACVHLGGISFVPAGADNPDLMNAVNRTGTVNLLESLRKFAPECRTLVVTTAQVYGTSKCTEPISEETPFAPSTEYSKSKAEADNIALEYADKYDMHIITARPNNHTGPGQSPKFVVPSFANQAKAISRGEQEPLIRVGNLESTRDFSDVRDVTRAYRLLLENGRPKEAYNISACHLVTMQNILDKLCELTNIEPEIVVDQKKFRPTDSSPLLDISKIETDTGWQPVYSFEQTLKDMLKKL